MDSDGDAHKTARKCRMDFMWILYPKSANECWVEHFICVIWKLCIVTCLWYGLFSEIDGNTGSSSSSSSSNTSSSSSSHSRNTNTSDQKTLNPCTLCDEKRYGPQLLRCAGANRVRCGILSDIERHNEVCTVVRAKAMVG